jgi:hypothetical protein
MAVNLRDQIRHNDTVPLQFQYEPADCRMFYAMENVWNMSRLWRDSVTAAFDDASRCIEGSTGSSNSTKDAPKLAFDDNFSLQLNVNESDTALVDEDLDLSGGPQGCVSSACLLSFVPTAPPDCSTANTAQLRCIEFATDFDCVTGQSITARKCVPSSTEAICRNIPGFEFDALQQLDVGTQGLGFRPRVSQIVAPRPGTQLSAAEVRFGANVRRRDTGVCRPRTRRRNPNDALLDRGAFKMT